MIFDFSDHHALSFTVKDEELMLLNLKISDSEGTLLVDAVDNYVRQRHDSVTLQIQRGRFRVTGTIHSYWIPDWVRARLLAEDPAYGKDDMPLLDLQVVQRGVVRVRGCWIAEDRAVVITSNRLSFVRNSPAMSRPVTLIGEGLGTTLVYAGHVGTTLFGWGP